MNKIAFAFILCCVPAFAQVSTEPQITDAQKYHLRAVNAELQALNERAQPIVQERNQLIQEIVKEHPGYLWKDNQNGTGQLVKEPEKPAAPAPAPAPDKK